MTEQQIDRERLRAEAERAVKMYGPEAWPDVPSADFLALLDQLDQAGARIRDLTQEVRDERAACLDQIEQVRVRDARIKAVEDVLDQHESIVGDSLGVPAARIRRALDAAT